MSAIQYPFIDIAVHERVRAHFAKGEATVLFSAALDRVLWSNGEGAALFGQDSIYDFIDAGTDRSNATFRQMEAAARQLASAGESRSFMMRIASGFRSAVVTASVERLTIHAGEPAILFAAPLASAHASPEATAQKMISGFDDPDTHMAVLDGSGAVLAASPGFAGAGLSADTLAGLVEAVSGDSVWLVKRPVPGFKGPLPAALGKLSQHPALHLLFAVETGESEFMPAGEGAAFEDAGQSVDAGFDAALPDQGWVSPADSVPAAPVPFFSAPSDVAQSDDAPSDFTPSEYSPSGFVPDQFAGSEMVASDTSATYDAMISPVMVEAEPEPMPATIGEPWMDAPPAQDASPVYLDNAGMVATETKMEAAPFEPVYGSDPADLPPPLADFATSDAQPASNFVFNPVERAVRFVWKIDAEGRFRDVSHEFAAAVGPVSAGISGRAFADVAADYGLDPDGKISDLLKRRDTWSGKTIFWPVDGTRLRVPVDLAALPTYSRNREFDGFRGFGIVRLADAVEVETLAAVEEQAEADLVQPVHFAPEPVADEPAMPAFLPADEAQTFYEQPADAPETDALLPAAAEIEMHDTAPEPVDAWSAPATDEIHVEQDMVAEADNGDVADVLVQDAEALPDADAPFEQPFDQPSEQIVAADDHAVAAEVHETVDAEDGADLSDAPPESTDDDIETTALMVEPVGAADESETLGLPPETVETVAVDEVVDTGETMEVEPQSALDAREDPETAPYPPADAVETTTEDKAAAAAPVDLFADLPTVASEREALPDPFEDPFRGEPAALRLTENPGRRETDKIAQLENHRQEAREALSRSEQAAFLEIARQLGKVTPPATETTVSAAGPAATRSLLDMAELDVTETPRDVRPAPVARESLAQVQDDFAADGLTAAVLENLPVAILVHGGDTLYHANSEFLRLTGYESVEALSAEGGIDALFTSGEDEGIELPEGTLLVISREGRLLPVKARLQSTRFEGRTALLLAITPFNAPQDSSTTEQALRREADELRAILETATDGVVVIGRNGEIRSMNGSAAALFNYDDSETRGKPFAMLFAHESQKGVLDYIAGLAGHGVASVLNDGREVIGREASGGFIPLFITMGHLASSNGYCAVIRDITQWKRTEDELRTAKRSAETANAHKTEFLARVSHEIRTPLNAIIGFSDMMATEHFGPIGNPRYVEYATDIGRSGRHVLDIVNDLLDISKIEAGEMDLEFTAVELNEAVSEAVSLVQPQANMQRVIIRTSLSGTVPNIVADTRSIKQIALNILANAIRFTPSGGQIVVSTAYETNGSVILRIRDTGIGMTRGELEQAMKPFRQVTAGVRKRGDGTGLGLPLTKAMAEANRAQFSINSAPNEGTLVEISFPSQRVLAD